MRIIEGSPFYRLGGRKQIKVNLRIISATSRDLREEVINKNFREDLFYRISTFPIFIPPLRNRKEDIPPLIKYFIDKFNKENNKNIRFITQKVYNTLLNYDYPGNIRELEHILAHAIILTDSDTIELEHLPSYITYPQDKKITQLFEEATISLKDLETLYINKVLEKVNFNKQKAARILKISSKTLNRKLDRNKNSI